MKEESLFINAVEIAKKICELKLKPGNVAVDCTMGNGNDTALLCRLVGENGKVYAFDIQESAAINTREKLMALNVMDRAELILDGHQNIDQYVEYPVNLVLFNLGYLPKGNHEITTQRETTLQAVNKSLQLLVPNGIVLLVLYPGHEEGKAEKEVLEELTSNLNQKEFSSVKLNFTNQINHPPELICIEKVLKK